MTIKFLLEDLGFFKADTGVQRKPFPAFVVFLVPPAQNNHHTKAAYLGGGGVRERLFCYSSLSTLFS